MIHFTKSRFLDLVGPVCTAWKAESCFQSLASTYSRDGRHYHALWHINECLGLVDEFRSLAQSPVALELSVWFHDFVYTPGARDNAECSAEAAACWLRFLDIDEKRVNDVRAMIRCTEDHVAPETAPADASLLIDIDLASFGASPARFAENSILVRHEFSQTPDPEFETDRASLLRKFLNRTRIYQTGAFYARYEAQARLNLMDALENAC